MQAAHGTRYLEWGRQHGRCAELRCAKAVILAAPRRDDGPEVMWEMRYFIGPLAVERRGYYWHRWYKDRGYPPDLESLLAQCGAEPEDWLPSLKQATSLGWGVAEKSGLFPEVVASTKVVLVHLLDWSRRLREPTRAKAVQIGSDLVARLLGSRSEDAPADLVRLPGFSHQACSTPSTGGETCSHCEDCGRLAFGGVVAPVCKVFDHVAKCWAGRNQCLLLHAYAWRMVVALADLMDERLLEPGAWPSDAPQNASQRGPVKRERLDQGQAFVQIPRAILAKRFRTAVGAQRCGGWDVSRQRAQQQCALAMFRYVGASRVMLHDAQQLHMALDESTFGGEGTLLAAFVDPVSQQACWGGPTGECCLRGALARLVTN